MLIDYWKCDHNEYEESMDSRYYGCSHPDNKNHVCILENISFAEDCSLLDINTDDLIEQLEAKLEEVENDLNP